MVSHAGANKILLLNMGINGLQQYTNMPCRCHLSHRAKVTLLLLKTNSATNLEAGELFLDRQIPTKIRSNVYNKHKKLNKMFS